MENKPYWDRFVLKEETFYEIENHKYLKKGYLHFDNRVWFPDKKVDFSNYVLNPSNVVSHSFLPFIKIVLSTKRIRFNAANKKRHVVSKDRPICYAAHYDSLIYSFYATILSELYEQYIVQHGLNDCVLAYRPLGRNNIDFANDIFNAIKKIEECSVITLDIKSFFDTLNHKKLKESWIEVLSIGCEKPLSELPLDHYKIFRSVSKFSFVERNDVLSVLGYSEKTVAKLNLARYCSVEDFREKIRGAAPKIIKVNQEEYGIPQGSPISAILSNIYMVNYDKRIMALSKEYDFTYRRYCDDVIVICKSESLDKVKELLYDEIRNINLTIQPEKEEVIDFRKNDRSVLRAYKHKSEQYKSLQYLGFEFNGNNIYVRSSSLSKYHRRLRAGVRETIKRAYGKKSRGKKIFRKKLHDRFTHLGGRNFISYAMRAAEAMQSSSIRKQIAKHTLHLDKAIDEKRAKHEKRLAHLKKTFTRMK